MSSIPNTEAPKEGRFRDWQWVSQLLGCGRQRVYNLARMDVIPHVRVAGRVLFDPDALERWLAAGGSSEPGAWRNKA